MPRVSSDSTVTHRIEFGLVERDKINQIIKTQKENQRIDGITATMQAVGMAIGGIGALGAGLALAAWLAPGLLSTAKNKATDVVNNATNAGIDVLNEILPPKAQIPTEKGLRAEYDELVANFRASAGRKTYYCTPSSIGFNEQQCQIATEENINDRKEIDAFYERIKNIQTAIKDGTAADYAGMINPLGNFLPGGKWAFWED